MIYTFITINFPLRISFAAFHKFLYVEISFSRLENIYICIYIFKNLYPRICLLIVLERKGRREEGGRKERGRERGRERDIGCFPYAP